MTRAFCTRAKAGTIVSKLAQPAIRNAFVVGAVVVVGLVCACGVGQKKGSDVSVDRPVVALGGPSFGFKPFLASLR